MWEIILFSLAIGVNLTTLYLAGRGLRQFLPKWFYTSPAGAVILDSLLNGLLLFLYINGKLAELFSLSIAALSLMMALSLAWSVTKISQTAGQFTKQHRTLSTEHKLLQNILDSLPFPTVFKGREGVYLVANRAYNALLGKNHESLIGKKDTDFFPRWQAKKNAQAEETAMQKGTPQSSEEELITANGKRWWEVLRIPVLDEAGIARGILVVHSDLSPYKNIETEYRETQARLETIEKLRQFDHALMGISMRFILAEEEGIKQGFQEALKAICRLTASTRAYLLLFEEPAARLSIKYQWHAREEERRHTLGLLLEEPALLEHLPRIDAVQILLSSLPPQGLRTYMQKGEVASVIIVPMIAKREVAGFLWLESDDEGKHARWEEAREALKSAALVLVNAIERQRELARFTAQYLQAISRVKELERRAQETELLAEMGDLLQLCRTVDEAYPIISRTTQQLIPSGYGAMYLIKNPGEPAEKVITWGKSQTGALTQEVNINDCWALRRGKAHLVSEFSTELVCNHVKKPYPSAYLCIPLIAQGESVGLLYFDTHEEGKKGKDMLLEKHDTATKIAEHIALALSNLSLRDRLRSQAIRDPLTNLFNRRYMEETLEREIRRAVRHKTPVGIIFMDIDQLKNVNDAYGHDAGDIVLKEIGNLLLRSFRGEDIACRFGGDEFTVILPEATISEVWRRAEQLREACRKISIEYKGKRIGPITFSIGIAAYPEHGNNAETLLKVCDKAAYTAKMEGRDRIMIGSALEE